MSVTKLKTVGNWHLAYWQHDAAAEPRTASVRGRVITGMLTGGDLSPDGHAVVQDPRGSQVS